MPLLVHVSSDDKDNEATVQAELLQHWRKSHPLWTATIQGNCVEVKRSGLPPPKCVNRQRGEVGPWSHQSRMKMLRLLNRIDYARIGPALFVTLTYPDRCLAFPYKRRTVHRTMFLRYLEKHLGRNVPCIWRIEWEQRQSGQYTGKLAPHFHLMLFGVRWLAWQTVREWWRQASGAGEGPLVTEVKAIYNQDGACRYLSKYVSKYRSLDIGTYLDSGIDFGRHWGVTRKELIPMCPVEYEGALPEVERKQMQVSASQKLKYYDAEAGGGFTLLGEYHRQIFLEMLKGTGQEPT